MKKDHTDEQFLSSLQILMIWCFRCRLYSASSWKFQSHSIENTHFRETFSCSLCWFAVFLFPSTISSSLPFSVILGNVMKFTSYSIYHTVIEFKEGRISTWMTSPIRAFQKFILLLFTLSGIFYWNLCETFPHNWAMTTTFTSVPRWTFLHLSCCPRPLALVDSNSRSVILLT